MKKFLAIVAAVGLTSSITSSVVSCTNQNNTSKVRAEVDEAGPKDIADGIIKVTQAINLRLLPTPEIGSPQEYKPFLNWPPNNQLEKEGVILKLSDPKKIDDKGIKFTLASKENLPNGTKITFELRPGGSDIPTDNSQSTKINSSTYLEVTIVGDLQGTNPTSNKEN
ncbi:lipoprotein [Mesoplasma lactucae]|uniref:Uncharacterized protein n=1 Tax=Mesoplasma lactucae ATCC 49193 TaxID=81460 RepID=A0A291IQU1_9MOLU|nr:lipoprotein [Mesoplasma lactucae]ATG97305.1 hypothetical protein CP520_00835 [Mesoplasma lactucae ATCC 49193]ATZ20245.1 hypothetical protein MLACT_v1c04240 [Mesoplasma lactucae ATCC 49193]MCL8216994.1 hypothetical protein [Mesoplasma lactucae ATCC 49193]